MKSILFCLTITTVILFAGEEHSSTEIRIPLDARQLSLPPFDLPLQTRDFAELLGISTTAPAPNDFMFHHADIPDTILDAGPIDGFIYYGSQNNWELSDVYYLGTPGYENTYEGVHPTPNSGVIHAGFQADIIFDGLEVTVTQCPYNYNNNVPAPWYLTVNEDPTGDSSIGEPYFDIDEIGVAISDDRIHVHLSNAGGGFDTGSFFGPWNLYVVGFLNPEDADSSLYGLGYGDGGFGLLYPGVWKFQLGSDFPEFVADIEYSISGNELYMAANMDDIFNDPDFGTWPNEFESIIVTGLTVQASLSDMTIADQTDPAFLNPDFQSYEIGVNTPPQISDLTAEVLGDSSGLLLVQIQTMYIDEDNHFPLLSDCSISQNGNEVFSGEMLSYDHFYNDGSVFEIMTLLQPGNYEVSVSFSDGMDVYEATASFDFSGGETDYEVAIISGWNLVGLSVNMDDPSQLSVFPTSIEETLYGFTDSYYLTDSFNSGFGYWLRFDNDDLVTIGGSVIHDLSIFLIEGWNLIAGPTGDVVINSAYDPNGLIVPGTLFRYDVSGYLETDTILSGYGYWIRSFGDGEISLSIERDENVTSFPMLEKIKTGLNTITLNGKPLYFGISNLLEREKLSFSLPPKPPIGAKDVRFSGDTKFCELDECKIEVMNDGSPLTFEFEITNGESWELVTESGKVFDGSSVPELELNGDSETLVLRKSNTPKVPTAFTLFPAYPNPFNPVTNIQFSVPEKNDVNISIYDVQGRLIETLLDKNLNPGNHSVQWNANGVTSGVYFVSFEEGGQREIQKVVLMK